MIRFAILVFAIDLANGQLNYEGNPFTEYTEYIAEESNLSEESAKKNEASIDLFNPASRPQKLYPVVEPENDGHLHQVAETDNLLKSHISSSIQTVQSDTSARQFQDSSGNTPISQAQVALNTFLNSKTPEESRLSLDHYLRSQHPPASQSRSSDVIIDQESSKSIEPHNPQSISHVEQQQQLLVPQVNQQKVQLTPQVDQVQLVPQLVPQTDQRQQLLPPAGQAYGYVGQPSVVQPMIRTPAGVVLGQKMLQPVPFVPAFQTRNEMITPAMWRERMRRIRGKPFSFAQPRIAPALYQGPIAGEKRRRHDADSFDKKHVVSSMRKNNNFLRNVRKFYLLATVDFLHLSFTFFFWEMVFYSHQSRYYYSNYSTSHLKILVLRCMNIDLIEPDL